jgi:hypothetical protein
MKNTIKHQQNMLGKFYSAWTGSQTGTKVKEEEQEMYAFYQHLKVLITPQEEGIRSSITERPDLTIKKGFEEAISFLVRNIEPEKIFLLPQCSDNKEHHLLVIIPDDEVRLFEELIKLQDDECLKKDHIVLQLLKASIFENTPTIYFAVTCNEESLLYDNGYFALPVTTEEVFMSTKAIASECFYSGLEKMETFLEGAKIYQEDNPPMAAFHLHQAIDIILNSLLKSITGKITQGQTLGKLLQSSLCCNPEILQTLGTGSKEDNRLMDLLEAGYSGYCYSNNYIITAEEVDILITWVSELYTIAEDTFTEWSSKYDLYFLNPADHE